MFKNKHSRRDWVYVWRLERKKRRDKSVIETVMKEEMEREGGWGRQRGTDGQTDSQT